jgi:hypothetical protein
MWRCKCSSFAEGVVYMGHTMQKTLQKSTSPFFISFFFYIMLDPRILDMIKFVFNLPPSLNPYEEVAGKIRKEIKVSIKGLQALALWSC